MNYYWLISGDLRDNRLFGASPFRDITKLRQMSGGVSEKMLAQTLQCLERDGFINRVSLPVVPPHVEYTLTPMGVEVGQKVEALADWIECNLSRILQTQQESDL